MSDMFNNSREEIAKLEFMVNHLHRMAQEEFRKHAAVIAALQSRIQRLEASLDKDRS